MKLHELSTRELLELVEYVQFNIQRNMDCYTCPVRDFSDGGGNCFGCTLKLLDECADRIAYLSQYSYYNIKDMTNAELLEAFKLCHISDDAECEKCPVNLKFRSGKITKYLGTCDDEVKNELVIRFAEMSSKG